MPADPLAFYNVASLALECVCQQMNDIKELDTVPFAYPGCPCHVYVSSATPAWDYCCFDCGGDDENSGQLTVHVDNVFESENFPTASQFIHPCRAALWVASIVVTIVRCAPVFSDEMGEAPTDEVLDQNAMLTLIDRWAVLQALTCCLPTAGIVNPRRKRKVQITGAAPVSDGGCAGAEVRALVEVGYSCGCPDEGS